MSERNYRNQFGGYDNELLYLEILQRLTYLGAFDSSWGNDACPSIMVQPFDTRWIKVWVDWAALESRESDALVTISVVDEEENWIMDYYREYEANHRTAGLIEELVVEWIEEENNGEQA